MAREWHCIERNTGRSAEPGGRAAWSVGLQPLDSWDRGFESRWRYGCSYIVLTVCRVSSGLWDGLITRLEESYRVFVYVSNCKWPMNLNNEAASAWNGLWRHRGVGECTINMINQFYRAENIAVNYILHNKTKIRS